MTTTPRRKNGISIPFLAELRTENLLIQRELAAKAGVTQKTIVRAEAGERIAFQTVRQIAAALDMEPKQLIAFRPHPGTQDDE
jgi:transcriptional regulator with XRE-family HTH domain